MTRLQSSGSDSVVAAPGRACTNCSRVKCKCIYRTNDALCERCQRLNKACVPSPPARPRGGKRRTGTRVARLEERLDEMASILRTQNSLKSQTLDEGSPSPISDEIEHHEPIYGAGNQSIPGTATASTFADDERLNVHLLNMVPGTINTPASTLSYDDEPSIPEAEELLSKFREERILFNPFTYIPPHITSQQLRELYPFFWLNIMSTMSTSPRRRAALGDRARNSVIQRVVVNREKSMDLLLGLLTLLSWSHLRLGDRPYVSMFTRLLATLLCDLGLHKPEEWSASGPTPVCVIIKENGPVRFPAFRKTRTDEERRAALGAFTLNTMLCYGFKLADGLRWSSTFDEYLTHLDQNSLVPQDKILVAQVRMQLVVNQIYHASPSTNGSGPPDLYLSAIRSHLYAVAKTDGINNYMLRSLLHFTELLINYSSILKPTTPWNDPDLRRFETYNRCLASIKAWLDTFFSITPALFPNLPLTAFQNLIRVMAYLHSLATLDDPAWDKVTSLGSLDLIQTCDRLVNLFESLKTSHTSDSAGDYPDESWGFAVKIITALKRAWQEELATTDVIVAGQAVTDFSIPSFSDFWMSDMFNASW